MTGFPDQAAAGDDAIALAPLPWDSGILGYRCGALSFRPSFPDGGTRAAHALGDALARARREGFRFLTAKVEVGRTGLSNLCLGGGGFLADTEVCFSKRPERPQLQESAAASCITSAAFWDDSLCDVAQTLNLSRFFRDPRIGAPAAERLWRESIRNHCGGRASYSVICFRDSLPAGFINVVEREGISNIFIIGVLPQYQGQGLGSLMIRYYESNLSGAVNEMTVDTQLSNIMAQKLYVSTGYRIIKSQHIIHFWLSD